MKHLFIPYELAVIAKEKGFDEYCLGEYTKHAKSGAINLQFPKYEGLQGDWPNEHEIDAPLYQQIIDWFREKHEMLFIPHSLRNGKFTFSVEYLKKQSFKFLGVVPSLAIGIHGKYYEALNKAIEEAFKLI